MSVIEIMSANNRPPLFTKPIEETTGKWNPETIEHLKEMIADKMSTSQIAVALSRMSGFAFTRNAIIGKARRLDLPLKFKASPRPRDPDAKPQRVKTPPPQNVARKPARRSFVVSAPQFPLLENIVANPLKRTIYEMQRGECYWPVASGEEKGNILFCGHATGDTAASWCAAHRKIGYQKPWERR